MFWKLNLSVGGGENILHTGPSFSKLYRMLFRFLDQGHQHDDKAPIKREKKIIPDVKQKNNI